MLILALDVGTSSIKAAVLDVATLQPIAAVARASYDLDFPTADAVEVPAERLWEAVTTAARAAVRALPANAPPLAGIGMGVLTPSLVLLDKADRPLRPIWTHLDRRARPTARRIWGAVGAEFLQTIGNRPLPGGITAVCFRQQVQEDPYLTHQVTRYLHVNGWLGLRLTGQAGCDPGNASFTGVFDTMTTRAWSPRWCDYFEIEPRWLPPVLCGSTTLGALRSEVAAELGVPPGLPVKLGTADTSCAMLAADMTADDLLHVVGTTQVLAAIVPQPRPQPALLTRLLGVGDAYIQVTHNPVGGVALDWLHQLCFREQSKEEFYKQTIAQAQERTTRVTLDPPYLGGDRLEIEAAYASFRDLTLATDRLELLAAVLQSMLRCHQASLRALGRTTAPRRVILTGGGAEVVRQLVPEYRQWPVEQMEEGSLRGIGKLFQ